jgi:2-desacetyl-2-hydroxyethyl bacteriochlorophyllide A dehydrogenase
MQIQQVIVTGQNHVELQDVEFNERLGPDEFLVETECTFISAGTELANYTGKDPQVFLPGSWCAYPWRSGYANVGKVTAVAENVTCVKLGQRVFTCGPHASVIKASQRMMAIAVPDGMDPAVAAASRMAGVATTAVTVAEIGMHPWVVVFGLGMVGNLAAQAFRILGGRVIGVDLMPDRRALAERCGIPVTVGGTPEEVRQAVADATGGAMADIAVEATGLSPVILQALGVTANLGQCILLGSPRTPFDGSLTAVFSEIHLRNIAVRGALEWVLPEYPPVATFGGKTLPLLSHYDKQAMIFDWVKRGEMQIAPLISHRLPAWQVKEGYDGLLQHPANYTGVVLDWQEGGK